MRIFHSSYHQKSMKEEVEARNQAQNPEMSGKIAEKTEDCDDKDNDDEQRKQVNSENNDSSILTAVDVNTRASSSLETLTAVPSDSCALHRNFEEPVGYGVKPLETVGKCKGEIGISNQDEKATADQAGSLLTKNQQEQPDGPSSSELSPTSVTQSISSLPSPSLPEKGMSAVEYRDSLCVLGVEKQKSFDPSNLSVVPVKTPSPDGFNWRKYGQKQVKSPQGSRSYYRCTYSACYAKKIECSNEFSCVREIIYKSHHNHDPPRKPNYPKGSRLALPGVPVKATDSSVNATEAINLSLPSTSSKDPEEEKSLVNSIGQESSGTDENPEIELKQEHVDETEPRKRLKKTPGCSEPASKPGKKPKFVVHAAGDVGISGDGFRWRKYGQKMVKGNPHPRNYYRCTSAGCPVRKHIEMAKDNGSAVIITYKGSHDHDMPVPKKRHSQMSAPLIPAAASASASLNASQNTNSEVIHDQVSASQWSVNNIEELTGERSELSREKTMESARTLLGIGFEIKPCSDSSSQVWARCENQKDTMK